VTQDELTLASITDLQRRMRSLERAVGRLQRLETASIDQLLSAFLALPGLRGFWPLTSMGDAGAGVDLSGQGRTLTNNNGVDFSHSDSIGHAAFASASLQYFSRTDEAGLDIAGDESYVATAIQGLTLGGWFWCNGVGAEQGFLSKWVTVGQTSYRLMRNSSNLARLSVTNSVGLGLTVNGGTSPSLTAGEWFFVVGRYISDAPLMVSVNNVQSVTGSVAPTAPLFNSTSALEIGRTNGGGYLNGRAACCFLCAAAVPDSQLTTLFKQSRGFFGV
jgi:hypothetical protein